MASAAREKDRQLTLEYTGDLIKHLGLSMYSGAVPALAELVANAWDADAKTVWLTVPFGVPLKSDHEIVVEDDGVGMSWEDVRDHYLVVGRDRRRSRGEKTPGGRTVMGRKGIGKLAGFGLAKEVDVRTVRKNWLVHFIMQLEAMRRATGTRFLERYHPHIQEDRRSKESNGTKIVLRKLNISRAINEEEFRDSMARRFSVLSAQFKVLVNGRPLARDAVGPEKRVPPSGLNIADVPGFGKVKWWVGFTEKPIKAVDARGIAVLVRGKMAQQPFFFGSKGGATAQFAFEYMMGEVYADQLDADDDYVGTSRQDVNWEEPLPAHLFEWGTNLVRDMADDWLRHRTSRTLQDAIKSYDETGAERYEERLASLTIRERKTVTDLIGRVARIDRSGPSAYKGELVGGILDAVDGVATSRVVDELTATTTPKRRQDIVSDIGELDTARTRRLFAPRIRTLETLLSIDSALETNVPWDRTLLENPWILAGAWRNVVVDKIATAKFRRYIGREFSSGTFALRILSHLRLVVVDKENETKARFRQVTALFNEFEDKFDQPHLSLTFVAPMLLNIERPDSFRAVSTRDLLERCLKSHQSFLAFLDAQ